MPRPNSVRLAIDRRLDASLISALIAESIRRQRPESPCSSNIVRQYHGLNRLTQEQTPQGAVNYAYDAAGRRCTMAVAPAGGTAVNYSYTWDNANRLSGIYEGNGGCASTGGGAVGFSYDNANRRATLTLPNGVTVSYSYDGDSHVTKLQYGMGGVGSQNLGALTYGYDADGRRINVGGSLAALNLPAAVPQSSTAYNADNEQTAFGNAPTLTYDADGNLTSDGTNTYAWDARNHLTTIAGAASASFVYDAFGRRAGKTIGGNTTQFLYDGLNPAQELSGGGNPTVTANLLTGLSVDEYFARTDACGTSTLLADALGSTVGLVNSGGAIATSYTYEPFGNVAAGGDQSANSYQFTGRENDGDGLYFYYVRYYSPTFQPFIAQDPIGFAGGDPNLYAYT